MKLRISIYTHSWEVISSLSFESKSNAYAWKLNFKKCIFYWKKNSPVFTNFATCASFQDSRDKLNSSGLWLLRVIRKLLTFAIFFSRRKIPQRTFYFE